MHVCMYVCTPVSHQNNLRAVLCLMEKFERTKSQLPFVTKIQDPRIHENKTFPLNPCNQLFMIQGFEKDSVSS